MVTNNYTTKTASLKATKADVNSLNTKKIKVNGKDVATSVKHPDDTREVITENDLWGSWAEITKDGEIVFHEDEVTNPNKNNSMLSMWNRSITKVVDNKAYIGNTLYANIQTEKIVDGEEMFYNCDEFTTFDSDLSSLETAANMFSYSGKLAEFASDLSSLRDGFGMFTDCPSLTSFNTTNLSSLTNGKLMFDRCSTLTSFTSDLSSLTNGYWMFSSCDNLTTFASDLSSLTNAFYMFNGCENLTTFTSDLSSLTNACYMFEHCKLDTDSLIHIAETIKDVNGLTNGNDPWSDEIYKTIHLGIGSTTPTEEEKELLTEIHNKGWQVFVGCNGTRPQEFLPTSLIPIDGEETVTPIPFYAKPIEVDKEHANYVGEDGKYYIILGGNFILVDDIETYGLFTSLEDAAANMRLTPYKHIKETINQN